jgi:acyl-CoA thioesterase
MGSDQPVQPISLEEATRLDGADGSYSVRLDDAWEIWGPSGGYLAAIALRAAGECAEVRRPASFYCHFLGSPAFDEVELKVELLKRGRRSESLSVRMAQGERQVLHALVQTATEAPGYEHQETEAPPVTPADASEPLLRVKDGKPLHPFWSNLSCRRPDWDGMESRAPATREWVRFEPEPRFDDPFVDAARPLILLDTYGWPAVWQKHRGAGYIAPNLDTYVSFHRPTVESEWLLVDHECPVAADGLLGVRGRVWDPGGRLMASGAAQLCCIPLPES